MLNFYDTLVGLGAEIGKLSSDIFDTCQEVNGVYDLVWQVHEKIRLLQGVSVTSASVMESGTKLSPLVSDDLKRIIASVVQLDTGVKTRLAYYAVQLDSLRTQVQNLSPSQKELSDMELGLALKDKLLRNIDFLCERVAQFIVADNFSTSSLTV
ncbi:MULTISPECIES: hypothetical protein [Pseudomonas syringae group]|uniref:hypothetical protein n=1 Tax=Pseudomonas syringae group TaxID=136849 RepID=UPI000A24CC42|nr:MULTISPECIES: hypothetical protein [Pseudomonas syringae group]MEE4573211.1 hypothetical protein [Pseudomonas alliivorans]OSR95751.1 hypothetical protein BV330_00076 [Pseudomonas syringae pv. actinidiae]OSR98534.1 hypothetical protein BV331_00074 [Pseudomonas syringae pv. actinidiae]